MEDYNPQCAIEAQKKFCEEHNVPNFAPAFDGTCFTCHTNIYLRVTHPSGDITGYTVDYAGKNHITCCPHCHHSFVD